MDRFNLDIKNNFFNGKCGETLAQVAQRCGRCPMPGSIKGQVVQAFKATCSSWSYPCLLQWGWAFKGSFQPRLFNKPMILTQGGISAAIHSSFFCMEVFCKCPVLFWCTQSEKKVRVCFLCNDVDCFLSYSVWELQKLNQCPRGVSGGSSGWSDPLPETDSTMWAESHLQQQNPIPISSPCSLPSARISSRLLPLLTSCKLGFFCPGKKKINLLAQHFKVMYLAVPS